MGDQVRVIKHRRYVVADSHLECSCFSSGQWSQQPYYPLSQEHSPVKPAQNLRRIEAELQKELGLTVVLTTHYMQETEAADHVVVLDKGRILAEGTPMALRTAHSQPSLLLASAAESRTRVIEMVEDHLPGSEWFEEGGAIHLPVPDSATALSILMDLRGVVTDFQLVQGSMEDVFLNLTAPGGAS